MISLALLLSICSLIHRSEVHPLPRNFQGSLTVAFSCVSCRLLLQFLTCSKSLSMFYFIYYPLEAFHLHPQFCCRVLTRGCLAISSRGICSRDQGSARGGSKLQGPVHTRSRGWSEGALRAESW